jgi:uncharacterized protein (TIRG00374 family)
MVPLALRRGSESLRGRPLTIIFLHALIVAPVVFVRAVLHFVIGERGESRQDRVIRIVRILGVLTGVGIAAYLVHQVGWQSIRSTLGLLGGWYLLVLAYPLCWILLNTTGWRWALHADFARIPLSRLAQMRLAGETFNSLLPSGYVGGEPLKAKLLATVVPMQEAASSVLIAKAAQSIGLVLFVGLGLTVGRVGGPSPWTQPATVISVTMLAIGIFIFTLLLTRRSFSRLGNWLHRLTGHPWLKKQEAKLTALDDSLGAFYREGKARFFISILWHCAGWIAGALEVAIIFNLVGHPIDWRQAWFIGAMGQLAAVVGLLSPAGVGFYEGGHYAAAALLGLPPSLGLSVSLIRRVREIFWDGVGLWLFWKLSKDSSET